MPFPLGLRTSPSLAAAVLLAFSSNVLVARRSWSADSGHEAVHLTRLLSASDEHRDLLLFASPAKDREFCALTMTAVFLHS